MSDAISLWIARLKEGDEHAANLLWDRYSRKLLEVAKWKLGFFSKRVFDEEDVVISVFDSLCRGASKGRFPNLVNRYDLWRLLLVISHQKATDKKRHQGRQKRGGAPPKEDNSDARYLEFETECLERILSQTPGPEEVAEIAEQHTRLLDLLADETLRKIAIAKMGGYTTSEIAKDLDVAPRTIQRKLRNIQLLWADELPM